MADVRLSDERAVISELQAALDALRQEVSAIGRKLDAAACRDPMPPPSAAPVDRGARGVLVLRSPVLPLGRDYWLTRCEGFLVETSTGRAVGIVEGIRFGSRIDRPDELQVLAGRLQRRVLLVPIDDVERVSEHDQIVVLNHDPLARRDLARTLLAHARDTLRVARAASADR